LKIPLKNVKRWLVVGSTRKKGLKTFKLNFNQIEFLGGGRKT
jgi:hypothetical protein